MNAGESNANLVLIQTSLLFSYKCKLIRIGVWFAQQKQWGQYQCMVTSNLTCFSFNVFATIMIMKWQGRGTELSSQLTPNPSKTRPHPPTPFIQKKATVPGTPYSFWIARGFFYVPQNYQHSRNCETGPLTYCPCPRRLESLTICRWNYKGSNFSSLILKTQSVGLVGVSNSQPATW